MVFYRKYRPQKIEDLDNQRVRETLVAILSKSVPHAFLFTGSRGLGKTSAARIVAKVLNCERRNLPAGRQGKKDIEPCNKCYQCTSITLGNNLDIIEIDGASNRGIDEVRDLREKIKLSTAKATKKVYIIDEVHMLTQEAFNALLKTLEEPPSHVVFVLCTTEPQKLPATIVSRCFQINFSKATREELLRSLKRIVLGEKLNIEKDALVAVANLSDGSFRDGAKILEEIVLRSRIPLRGTKSGRKKVTRDVVEKSYRILNVEQKIYHILVSIKDKDTKKGLEITARLVEDGVDMKYFLEQMVSVLHSMMLSKVGVESQVNHEVDLELTDIRKLLKLFSRANLQLKYSVLPQLPLELAIIEYTIDDNEERTELK